MRLAARPSGAGVELEVADTGPGIPPAERERVFEPFHSTRPGSHAGLGLSISLRIAEEAGGRIAIGDAPGGGASFRVWLSGREAGSGGRHAASRGRATGEPPPD